MEFTTDELVRQFLAQTDAIPVGARPDEDLKISHQTSEDGTKIETVSLPSRVHHLHGNDKVRIYVPDDEVIRLFQYKAGFFLELHQQHTAPLDFTLTQPFARRLGGCCRHLKDNLHKTLSPHWPSVPAHVHANTPYERLCIACIRQRRLAERYQCTTCGQRNPTLSKLKRRSAVETTELSLPPLSWHVPMCRRCRGVISTAYAHLRPTHTEGTKEVHA